VRHVHQQIHRSINFYIPGKKNCVGNVVQQRIFFASLIAIFNVINSTTCLHRAHKVAMVLCGIKVIQTIHRHFNPAKSFCGFNTVLRLFAVGFGKMIFALILNFNPASLHDVISSAKVFTSRS